MTREITTFALLGLTSFFSLMNPLNVMPIFLSMTNKLGEEQKKQTARKAVLVSFLTLIIFGFSGNLIFHFFGISINSLRVAGGIIFLLIGQDMLQARLVEKEVPENDIHKYVRDIAVTPLAIPMITGPGAITNAIVLMQEAHTIMMKITYIVIVLLVCAATYIVLLNSGKILRVIGETGNIVMMRLMGLIVMVIAVEFFFTGVTPIIRNIFHIAN